MTNLIALLGPIGSGKTTLAWEMVKHQGYQRTRFAEGLKRMMSAFLEMQGLGHSKIIRMLDGDFKNIETEFLSGRTPRHAMQMLGTEYRDLINKEMWVNAWEKQADLMLRAGQKVVVDDMRFVHEAKRVRQMGGMIIRIDRPGIDPGEHQSEKEYLEVIPDHIILNNGTPDDMIRQLP